MQKRHVSKFTTVVKNLFLFFNLYFPKLVSFAVFEHKFLFCDLNIPKVVSFEVFEHKILLLHKEYRKQVFCL